MLFKVNNDNIDIQQFIRKKCGDTYSILKRLMLNNFGSCRYKLLSIFPNSLNINLENCIDTIYLNFDLRNKGLVFFFRYRNTEFVEFCEYNKISFQSSDKSFVLQTDQSIYSFEILNKKQHKKFLLKLYKFKNLSNLI